MGDAVEQDVSRSFFEFAAASELLLLCDFDPAVVSETGRGFSPDNPTLNAELRTMRGFSP